MAGIVTLFEDNREQLDLKWVAGGVGHDVEAEWGDRLSVPNPIGYFNLIHPARIQVIGRLEDD
jgi:serine kinase of HPr protein (carbohydrate metabolism regulator)